MNNIDFSLLKHWINHLHKVFIESSVSKWGHAVEMDFHVTKENQCRAASDYAQSILEWQQLLSPDQRSPRPTICRISARSTRSLVDKSEFSCEFNASWLFCVLHMHMQSMTDAPNVVARFNALIGMTFGTFLDIYSSSLRETNPSHLSEVKRVQDA